MRSVNGPRPQKIKIGSRGSPLALRQVEEVVSLFLSEGISVNCDHRCYQTSGDQDKTTPLSKNPAEDFFTNTLDEALLRGEIDLAVHSAKDLPKNLQDGLNVFALTKCLDETDSLVAHTKLSQMKPGARIGTSSLFRGESVKTMNPGVQLVDIRGTIEERIDLFSKGRLEGVIVATCALKRLKIEHLIAEIMPWETTPLQGQLAIVGRVKDQALKDLCAALDVRKKYGRVSLVGAGPGDPQLITMKALKALETADCVFYDYLIPKKILEYAQGAQKIYVGKRKGDHTMPQAELSRRLKESALQGKKVVRLKGGDPLIFGRGADEIAYLRAYHIPVEIIPGVSSATGIPSSLGIPLTARGISSSVAFLSAHEEAEQSTQQKPIKIPQADTLVFLMGLTKLKIILQSLHAAGWREETPIMVISKGTTPEEKILSATLKTIEGELLKEKLDPPALIIVGETVHFYQPAIKNLSFPNALVGNPDEIMTRPPTKTFGGDNKKILYLGTNPQKYASLGEILHLPVIEITEAKLPREQKEKIIQDLNQYDLIIFTSQYGIKYFIKILTDTRCPLSKLNSIDCVVIGKETAHAFDEYGIKPKVIPSIETSEGLLNALGGQYDLAGKRILFPRSSLPNPYLKEELCRAGAQVTELTVYDNNNVPGVLTSDLPIQHISTVFFSSPSTVNNFLDAFGPIPGHWHILSKGPRTAQTLQEAGYKAEVFVER